MKKTKQKPALPVIALNDSRDIPLNQLVVSNDNVRKTHTNQSIETLAEDIARRGLMLSLSVKPNSNIGGNTEQFEIIDGGRRYRALMHLVGQKRIDPAALVACVVRQPHSVTDDSLAANNQREALHPVDQFKAFKALVDEGKSIEDIAATHGVSPQIVHQRLKLAKVSPMILEAYIADEIRLNTVQVFTLTDDISRQETIFQQAREHNNLSDWYIRQNIQSNTIQGHDHRVRFIGLNAYLEKGGTIGRDLFSTNETIILENPDLVDQLVHEKLTSIAANYQAEGWKWVEIALHSLPEHASKLSRFSGQEYVLTETEQAIYDALNVRLEEIDEIQSIGDETDEMMIEFAEIEAKIDAFDNLPNIFTPEEKAMSGLFLGLSRQGQAVAHLGYVKPEDALQQERSETPDPSERQTDVIASHPIPDITPTQPEEPAEKPLSDALVAELSSYRTVALRYQLGEDYEIAFLTLLHALCLKTFYPYNEHSCLSLHTQPGHIPATTPGLGHGSVADRLKQRHDRLKASLPAEPIHLYAKLKTFDYDQKGRLLAHCIGKMATVQINNTIHAARNKALKHGDQVIQDIGMDVHELGWRPTAETYLGRVSKNKILEAVREAKGEQQAQLLAPLKKIEMAKEAERMLKDTDWLPEILRSSSDIQSIESETEGDLPDFLENEDPEASEDDGEGDKGQERSDDD